MYQVLCPEHPSDVISRYPHNTSVGPKAASPSLEQLTGQALTTTTVTSSHSIGALIFITPLGLAGIRSRTERRQGSMILADIFPNGPEVKP